MLSKRRPRCRRFSFLAAEAFNTIVGGGLAGRYASRYNPRMTQHESLKPLARVTVGGVTFANDAPISILAGPCQMESRQHALEMAAALVEVSKSLGFGLVFKASFDKANRTSLSGRRGIGLEAALPVFAEIRETFSIPVVTDIHEVSQCAPVAEVVDVLQIPAFLCRPVGQTSSRREPANPALREGRDLKQRRKGFFGPTRRPEGGHGKPKRHYLLAGRAEGATLPINGA